MECIQDKILQKFLVRYTNFDGHARRAMFSIPTGHKRNVERAARSARSKVVWPRSPKKRNAIGGIVSVEGTFVKQRFDIIGQRKCFFVILVVVGKRFE